MANMFKPGTPVVWRGASNRWHYGIYDTESAYKKGYHNVIGHNNYVVSDDLLPFNEDTESLIGTTNDFVKWNPTPGHLIAVRDADDREWVYRIFIKKRNNGYCCVCDGGTYEENMDGGLWWKYASPVSATIKTD